jgi:hypothetical protein
VSAEARPEQVSNRTILTRPLSLPNGFVIPNRLAKAALSEGLGRRDFSPGPRIKNLYQSLRMPRRGH